MVIGLIVSSPGCPGGLSAGRGRRSHLIIEIISVIRVSVELG